MQSEGHFLFVDLIMLSSFVTPCFSLLYRFQEVLSSQKTQKKRRGNKLANINVGKWGKQRFPICQC